MRDLGSTLPPVVVVSANAQPEQIAAAQVAGAQHYLTKPLDVRELLALLTNFGTSGARGRGRMKAQPPNSNRAR